MLSVSTFISMSHVTYVIQTMYLNRSCIVYNSLCVYYIRHLKMFAYEMVGVYYSNTTSTTLYKVNYNRYIYQKQIGNRAENIIHLQMKIYSKSIKVRLIRKVTQKMLLRQDCDEHNIYPQTYRIRHFSILIFRSQMYKKNIQFFLVKTNAKF